MAELNETVVYTKREVLDFFIILYYRITKLGAYMTPIGIVIFIAFFEYPANDTNPVLLFAIASGMTFLPILLILISTMDKQIYDPRNLVVNEECLRMWTDSVQIKRDWREATRIIKGKTTYVVVFKNKSMMIIPKRIVQPSNRQLFERKRETRRFKLKYVLYIPMILTILLAVFAEIMDLFSK